MLSFRFAFEGWSYVLRTQPNARIHAIIMVGVVLLAVWLKLDILDWALLILTIVIVWMAEMANTALESVVNLLSPDFHQEAKIAKDVAAGIVLLSAVGAIIVGVLILGPRLIDKLFN